MQGVAELVEAGPGPSSQIGTWNYRDAVELSGRPEDTVLEDMIEVGVGTQRVRIQAESLAAEPVLVVRPVRRRQAPQIDRVPPVPPPGAQ